MPKLSEVSGEKPRKLKLSQVQQQAAQPKKPAAAPASQENPHARDLKLGTRAAMEGVASIPDFFGAPVRLGIEKITGEPLQTMRGAVGGLADRMGLPRPNTPGERVRSDIAAAGSGAAVTMGGGTAAAHLPGMVGKTAQMFAANPRLQFVSAGTGATAAGVTRENGGSPFQQFVAGLAGGLSPAIATTATQAATRGLIRGRQVPDEVTGVTPMQQRIDDFRAAGTTPTVGQATDNRAWRGLEWFLSKLPGSANVILRKAEQQQEEMGTGLGRIAATLSDRRNASDAGRSIERGIRGNERGAPDPQALVPRTREVESALYNRLDGLIPPNTRVPVDNTRLAFDNVNQGVPGAPELSQGFRNARIGQLDRQFTADSTPAPGGMPGQGPVLPYEAVRRTRTLVGREIDNTTLASDVPRSMWRPLYEGLSDDLGVAARGTGPAAQAAWQRANRYSRARADRLESVDHVVNAAGGPEKIFAAAVRGTDEGATTLRAVMQSIPEAGRRQVTATVLQRMGRVANNQQDDVGEQFSTNTFLTNWNKLHPQARSTLFSGYGAHFTTNMDKIARVAANLKKGTQMYANPSGTAAANAQFGGRAALVTSIGSALLGGPIAVPVGIVATGVIANITARRMVNPEFVAWLAKSTELPLGALAGQIPVLRQIAEDTQDAELDELADQLEQVEQSPRK